MDLMDESQQQACTDIEFPHHGDPYQHILLIWIGDRNMLDGLSKPFSYNRLVCCFCFFNHLFVTVA